MSPSTTDASAQGHYTFGDNDVAAQRLQLLSELFRPALEAFVLQHAHQAPTHIIDLGCGPGHTTRLLAHLLAPEHITGLDNSERFLEQARSASSSGREPLTTGFHYRLQDVTQPPAAPALPAADLLYSRFLLTHLPEPAAALGTWADYVRSGAVLLLQETASMSSPHPALTRYYELVGELQRRHGQRLDIGRSLAELVDDRLYRIVHTGIRVFALPGPSMARLHCMNIRTWRADPLAGSFDAEELSSLSSALDELSQSPAHTAEVRYGMGELVLERR